MTEDKKPTKSQSIFSFLLLIIGVWFFFGGGLQHFTNQGLQNVYNQVSTDTLDQYNIAKKHGNRTDICVQAGLVKASYMQAKDEDNFKKWTEIEARDCAYLGR